MSKQVSLMNPIEKLVAGLEIFLHYATESGARAWEHDEFYAGNTSPSDMADYDVTRLDELGWIWDEDVYSWMTFQ